MPFAPAFTFHRRFTEIQTFGDALGHTGRLQPLVDPVHAIVTFDHPACFRVPLGRSPGAGGHTGFTAHAQVGIDEYNPVIGSFLHRPGRACGHTPGIFTMKTRHEYVGHARQIIDLFGAYRNNLRQARTHRQIRGIRVAAR